MFTLLLGNFFVIYQRTKKVKCKPTCSMWCECQTGILKRIKDSCLIENYIWMRVSQKTLWKIIKMSDF